MKKVLLSTSALAGASILAAGSAIAAEKPSASVRGYYEFYYSYTDEDADTATNEYADSAWYTEYEFSIRANGKADNGLEYGAKYEVAPDANDTRDEAGMYIKHANFGTVMLGQDDGVANTMNIDAPGNVGTGVADGDYDEIARIAVTGPTKLVGGDMSLGDTSKISYYSPRFAGFDFGMSYAFTRNETDDTRSHRLITNGGSGAHESEIQMALRYRGKFQDVGVAAGVTFAQQTAQENRAGSANTTAFEDPQGFQGGLALSWGAWKVGASYIQWEDALTSHSNPVAAASGTDIDDATALALGIEYGMGPWTIGVNYLAEEAEDSTTFAGETENTAYGIGAEYALAPGLALTGEIVFFEREDESDVAANDNDGTVLIIGTQFSF